MKKQLIPTIFFLSAMCLLCASPTAAKPHIELGLNITTTTVLDNRYEFFSSDYLVQDTYGFDVRVEVLEIKKILHLLPIISYRYGSSYGSPMLVGDYMDTILESHDLEVGLRMRGWLLPWLGAFAQLHTGVTHLNMSGELSNSDNPGMRTTYECTKNKWNIGGLAGVEFRISPKVLKRANINRFNFGGEIGVGFLKRAKTNFNPELTGGDENSLDSVQTVDFGHIDFSGVVFQTGMTLSFL